MEKKTAAAPCSASPFEKFEGKQRLEMNVEQMGSWKTFAFPRKCFRH